MQLVTISLVVTVVTLCVAVLLFGFGEFSSNLLTGDVINYGFFEVCTMNICAKNTLSISLMLTVIGFIFALHSVLFSITSLLLQNRIGDDLFKFLLVVLVYNVLAITFMTAGWNELRLYFIDTKTQDSTGWSYKLLISGFSFNVIAIVPIVFLIFKAYKKN